MRSRYRFMSAPLLIFIKLRTQFRACVLPTRAGKITAKGSNADVCHTISDEDQRKEFTTASTACASVHFRQTPARTLDRSSRMIPTPVSYPNMHDATLNVVIFCKLINDSIPDTIDTCSQHPYPFGAFKLRRRIHIYSLFRATSMVWER